MSKLEKAYKLSMVFLVLLPFVMVWFVIARQQGPTPVDARPVGQIIESDQKAYDKLTGPGEQGVEPDKAFIRALKPDKSRSDVLEYDLSSPLTKPVKMDVYNIYDEVVEIDLDNPRADAGYIKPLCLGVAKTPPHHGPIPPSSRYSGSSSGPMALSGHPASLSFYDFDRRPLTEAQVKGLGVEYNGSTYMSDTNVLKVFYSMENMPGARLVDSYLLEARNLHQISRQVSDLEAMGYPPPMPKEGAAGVCSFYQNVMFPAHLRWVADVAYGPQVIDLPLKMGAEADFEDALVRIVSDEVVTQNMSPILQHDHAGFRSTLSHGTPKKSHVIAAQTPRSAQRLITYQFLDVDKNPLNPEYNADSDYESWNFAIAMHHNPTTKKAEYLRIRKYAGIKRFVMDIGRLPGTPPENDDVEDLMELQIPMFFGYNTHAANTAFESYLMLDAIRSVDLSDYHRRHSGSSGTVTPREALQTVVRSELSPKSVYIDWKNGELRVRDYAGWMDKLSDMLGGK